jgi:hypothetical protein
MKKFNDLYFKYIYGRFQKKRVLRLPSFGWCDVPV